MLLDLSPYITLNTFAHIGLLAVLAIAAWPSKKKDK